ncbi:protein KRI1 homolog [Periplaneta americana]|uniref:protein KRI1 homolog n=1 Tax=Periplaneta americana TaxID=6978 RepID=UPI0037E8A419
MLLGDDSDSEIKIEVNKNYADRYNTWRQKEELQKLKDRYGSAQDHLSDSASCSSEEDETAEQLTQQLEKDFFKTLSCLKKKDPSIYDEKVSFFSKTSSASGDQSVTSTKKPDGKPLFLRDYERKLIVEREGKLSDDEDIDETKIPTIAEEEKLIQESFKGALKDDDDEDDEQGTWGGLFQKRHKTKEELEKEEEDYREWLKGQKGEISDKQTESELKYLHDYWNNPNLSSNEAYLRDYILNKRFLEVNKEDNDYIPTYEEIVHDSDENLSEDEKTLEKQEEFEHKFNFRFEEPDKEFIKRYPRTMENSLRKKDDRRKRKRQEIKERKEAEAARKREELKRLKALKRKEIMEKIEKLKHITGNEEVGFKDEDLEGDFDPAEHDRRMSELFNHDFYEGEEDSGKPEFPELDEELEIENWNSWSGEKDEAQDGQDENELHCEDPEFNMDCDYDPSQQLQKEMLQASKGKKKGRKWKSRLAQAVAKQKPVFDGKSHTFDNYYDEYYKLDFEDLIGDLPCRFKYRNVLPNSFGLSVDEILAADDKELNQWCSLKKAVQHRPEHVEKYDVQAYRRKALNEHLKKKIFHTLYGENPTMQEHQCDETEHKKKRKKQRSSSEGHTSEGEGSANKKSKLVSDNVHRTNETESSDAGTRLKARPVALDCDVIEGEQPRKKKKKKKRTMNNGDIEQLEKSHEPESSDAGNRLKATPSVHDCNATEEEQPKKKKKKKSNVNNGNTEQLKKSNEVESCDAGNKWKETPTAQDNNVTEGEQCKKKKNKKKKKKHKEMVSAKSDGAAINKLGIKKNKNKFKHKLHGQNDSGLAISDTRLRAYGINPKKFKNKLKYSNTQNIQ